MNCKVLPCCILLFFIYVGYNSYRTTSYPVDTAHDIRTETMKICIEGDYDPLHLAHDRIVEMTASHEHFNVQMVNSKKFTFGDLVNKKDNDLLYTLPIYDHLIDSKRDENHLTFVIPPFQETCFEISLENKNMPVYLSIHTVSEFCPLTYGFLLLQVILLFYPRGFLFEILLIYLSALVIGGVAVLHPYLIACENLLCQKLGQFVGIPVLRFCNLLHLTALHAFKPLLNVVLLVYNSLPRLSEQIKLAITTLPEKCPVIAMIGKDCMQLACVYWKELTVTAVAVLIAVYIFFPSRGHHAATMRLMCVVGLAAALVYVSSSLALKIVGGSIILSACVMKMAELVYNF